MIIEKLKLENFKCFKQTDIEFGKITILTGANSSGKSSLIDALLIAFQTNNFPLYLSPNGSYVNLGDFKNIVNQNISSNTILINILFDFMEIESKWDINAINSLPELNSLLIKSRESKNNRKSSGIYYNKITKINENQYKLFDDENQVFNEMEDLINKIQFKNFIDKISFNFIDSFRSKPQRTYLQVPKASKILSNGDGFENQIIEWEEKNKSKIEKLINILSELKILNSFKTDKIGNGMFVLKVQPKPYGIFNSITDVGFGVSKILPVIVADLQLAENSLLAVSEPEIDLHPSVQANLANYFANQANKNQKQYIVETHSEYLINRLRLLIARGELKEEDVKMYFFENNGIETTTFPILLKKDGSIEGAPLNFFKTYTIDVMEIALNSFENE